MKRIIFIGMLFILLSGIRMTTVSAEENNLYYDDITPTFEEIPQEVGLDNIYIEVYNKWANLYSKYYNGDLTIEELQYELNEQVKPYFATEADIQKLEDAENEYKEQRSYDYYYDWAKTTAQEIQLCTFNASKCTTAYKYSKQAAAHASERYSGYTLWQGNGDAFRHAYWSALMTKYIDRDFAYEMGLAHEGLSKGYDFDKQSSDHKMDISNNYYGRKKGSAMSGSANIDIADNLAYHVSKGDLKRIRTYTSNTNPDYCKKYQGVCTHYVGYYTKTSDGGRRF